MIAAMSETARHPVFARGSPCLAVVLLLAGMLLTMVVTAGDEGELESHQQKLQTVQTRIKALEAGLEQKIGQRNQLELQLRAVEKELGKQHRALRKLQQKQRAGERELERLKTRQITLQKELKEQRDRLVAQLRTAYFIGHQEQLKLLLSQQDPSALARELKYFEYLNQARLQAIESNRHTMQQVTENHDKIELQNRQLATLSRTQEAEYEKIRQSRNQRHTVLETLKIDIRDNKSSVLALRQSETQLRELIATLSGIFADIPPDTTQLPFAELKGLLPWPVQGSPLNHFGDLRSGSDLHWRGIELAAPEGREVRAISHGRVAFADWIPVFGLIILIDHSGGYMSLYAHNQALYKDTGDWVSAGEVIANVGKSGGQQTDSLYFEIRHNGKPLNPAQWCTATGKRRSS